MLNCNYLIFYNLLFQRDIYDNYTVSIQYICSVHALDKLNKICCDSI